MSPSAGSATAVRPLGTNQFLYNDRIEAFWRTTEMDMTGWVIAGVVGLILLFLVFKFIKNCLPKILIALLILGAIGFIVFRYFIN